MIKAIIFDLDGTLIQTEILKARSYAETIHSLTSNKVSVQQVQENFKKYVGLSRTEVISGLIEDFLPELQKNLPDRDTDSIQDEVLTKRLSLYHKMIADKSLMSGYFCTHTLELLQTLYADNFTIAVATMSHLKQAEKIIEILEIGEMLDFVLTRENVSKAKPDPEIYLKAREKLNLELNECLVIEDSVSGVESALNANMSVFAATTSVTEESIHESNILPARFIIDDPLELKEGVYSFIEDHL